jgi:hypothetical protein
MKNVNFFFQSKGISDNFFFFFFLIATKSLIKAGLPAVVK